MIELDKSIIGSKENPIQLKEVEISYRKPLTLKEQLKNGWNNLVDEITFNKNNIRVLNAINHPKAMDAIEEAGNLSGTLVAAPFVASATLSAAAPYVLPVLNTVGLALTPSTWIGGLSLAAGYTVPNWILNAADMTATAYFANEARKQIDKEGLNLKTGFNALLSLAPFTRSDDAIKAVSNGFNKASISSITDDLSKASSSIKSFINNFRTKISSPERNFIREFNKSINNTKLINIPVEHVSPNGITNGSALNIGSEGIHLSPVGTNTSYNILMSTNYPFVRTGTWTVSNNTKPVLVQDLGYFGRGHNIKFDNLVDKGITNFSYRNNFEGKGNTSFLSMEPSQGLQLSKNIQHNYSPNFLRVVPEGYLYPDGTFVRHLTNGKDPLAELKDLFPIHRDYVNYYNHLINEFRIGNKRFDLFYDGSIDKYVVYEKTVLQNRSTLNEFSNLNDAKDFILTLRTKYLNSLDEPGKLILQRANIAYPLPIVHSYNEHIKNTDLGKAMLNLIGDDINEVYLSPEYIDRFIQNLPKKIVKLLENKSKNYRDDIIIPYLDNHLNFLKDNTYPTVYVDGPNNQGASWVEGINNYVGLNSQSTSPSLYKDYWDFVLFHEFGHNLYNQDSRFSKYLKWHTENLTKDIDKYIKPNYHPDNFIAYISEPDEFRQRMMEVVRHGIKEGLTPELMYNSEVMKNTQLAEFFDKNFLIKTLSTILSLPLLFKTIDNNDKIS